MKPRRKPTADRGDGGVSEDSSMIVARAKSIRRGFIQTRTASQEECELAVAWIRGEIGVTQANKALNRRGLSVQNTPGVLYAALRAGTRMGMIEMGVVQAQGRK